MKKFITLLLIVGMSIPMLAGCGDSTSEATSESPDESAMASESEISESVSADVSAETEEETIESQLSSRLEQMGDTVVDSGIYGTDIAWILNEDGLMTIIGSGYMEDMEWSSTVEENETPWGEYKNSIKSVDVDEGVLSIGDMAFSGCENLTEINLPDSVIRLGEGAFQACGFTSFEIPNGVTEIGSVLFNQCAELTEVVIPNSVTQIGGFAFEDCISLTNIEIPGSVEEIEQYTFKNCTALTDVQLNEGIVTIHNEAFQNTAVTDITIPSTVTSLGYGCFSKCSSINVTFTGDAPEFAASDHDLGCFFEIDGTITINYPSNNETWTERIQEINDIKNIEVSLFTSSSARDRSVAESMVCNAYDAALTGTCGEELSWTYSDGILTISGTGAMDDYAADGSEPWFSYCDSITAVNIGADVTAIGKGAFKGCTNLTSITFDGDAPSFGAACFQNVTATAYYPSTNPTWTDDVMQDRGGSITWVAY